MGNDAHQETNPASREKGEPVLYGRVSGHGQQELTGDLLALIASFSGRLYAMRSHKQQALVACAKQVLAASEE